MAAQESGVHYLTLHPRTKVDGYGPPAKWDLIAEAKSLLKIPVVGNGDILTVTDAVKMLETTRCDGLMIGRGALINPFLFHQIRSHFAKEQFISNKEQLIAYLHLYLENIPSQVPIKTRVNKLKQLLGFLFKKPDLLEYRQKILSSKQEDPNLLLDYSQKLIENFFDSEQLLSL